ncbi:MAG TPA: HAD family phosphatase [Acidobacteriota bacterium]|nr:HAD family phosphatase [Acidobacteriota bacterium]
MKIAVVCFDMDGTLIRNTDSVRYLCTLNGNAGALQEIEKHEIDGSISWIDADHRKARLIKGLSLSAAEDKFKDTIELIQNIEQVVGHLKERGIRSVLITAGPIQVAGILGTQFGFDGVYGSLYEVEDQRFTGRITRHLGNDGKLQCLKDFCVKNGIGFEHCVAVGDSESDIDLFEKCGRSIAINYSDAVKGKASEHLITDDLSDVIGILESWQAQ